MKPDGSIGLWYQHDGPHEWVTSQKLTSDTLTRQCSICGETQQQTGPADADWLTTRKTTGGVNYLPVPRASGKSMATAKKSPGGLIDKTIKAFGKPVSEFGGIVAYNPGNKTLQLGDGMVMVLEYLMAFNPDLQHEEVEVRLETLPSKFFSENELAERILRMEKLEQQDRLKNLITGAQSGGALAMSKLAEEMTKIGEAGKITASQFREFAQVSETHQPWSTEDALVLILETIKQSDDPVKAGGVWLTRITNEITKITREAQSNADES